MDAHLTFVNGEEYEPQSSIVRSANVMLAFGEMMLKTPLNRNPEKLLFSITKVVSLFLSHEMNKPPTFEFSLDLNEQSLMLMLAGDSILMPKC